MVTLPTMKTIIIISVRQDLGRRKGLKLDIQYHQ